MGDGSSSGMEEIPEPNEQCCYRYRCRRENSRWWRSPHASVDELSLVFSYLGTQSKFQVHILIEMKTNRCDIYLSLLMHMRLSLRGRCNFSFSLHHQSITLRFCDQTIQFSFSLVDHRNSKSMLRLRTFGGRPKPETNDIEDDQRDVWKFSLDGWSSPVHTAPNRSVKNTAQATGDGQYRRSAAQSIHGRSTNDQYP